MANENYLIPMEDVRFENVLQQWLMNLATSIEANPLTFNYFDSFELVCSTHKNIDPAEQVKRDVSQSLKYMCSSPVHTTLIAYKKSYVEFVDLAQIVALIKSKKRRDDYNLACLTTFSLSAIVDTELLDFQIPDVSLMMVVYYGTKDPVCKF